MSWRQFLAWEQYAEVEPFGEERDDLRIGVAFAQMASMFTRRGHAFRASDFMPKIMSTATTAAAAAPMGEDSFQRAKATLMGVAA